MKSKLLQDAPERTFAVIFDKGDPVIENLTRFAREQDLQGSHLAGIGAFQDITLGYFEKERNDYKRIPIDEQVEVVSLVGNVAVNDGEPKIHAHVVVATSDGMAHGGHLLEAHVWPTLEIVITEEPEHLRRTTDEATGLALISPQL